MTPENVVSKRTNACTLLTKQHLTSARRLQALAHTWTQLANMFESDILRVFL